MKRPVPPAPTKTQPAKGEPSWLARSLADKNTLLRVSFIANIGLVIFLLIQPHLIMQQLLVPQRAVLLDSAGTYSISPLIDINKATPLQAQAAGDAVLAMFQRSPAGLDNQGQADLWLTKSAREKLARLVEAETPDFVAKQFHQKIEHDKPRITVTGDGQFTAHFTGQLIRTGILNGRLHVETKAFDLQLPMIRNPDMLSNKRYPFAAWDFDIKYSR